MEPWGESPPEAEKNWQTLFTDIDCRTTEIRNCWINWHPAVYVMVGWAKRDFAVGLSPQAYA